MSWFICSKCDDECRFEANADHNPSGCPFSALAQTNWQPCDPPVNDPLRKADVELDSYIKGLEAENNKLKVEVEKLQKEIQSFVTKNENLRIEKQALFTEVERLKAEVERLKEQIENQRPFAKEWEDQLKTEIMNQMTRINTLLTAMDLMAKALREGGNG